MPTYGTDGESTAGPTNVPDTLCNPPHSSTRSSPPGSHERSRLAEPQPLHGTCRQDDALDTCSTRTRETRYQTGRRPGSCRDREDLAEDLNAAHGTRHHRIDQALSRLEELEPETGSSDRAGRSLLVCRSTSTGRDAWDLEGPRRVGRQRVAKSWAVPRAYRRALGAS